MDVTSKFFILLLGTAFSINLNAMAIDSCLSEATQRTHIIDQQQSIESCFQDHSKSMTQKKCFDAAARINTIKKQFNMSETLNSICFYQTSNFSNLKMCLNSAKLFKIADNHDEAIFECYKEFQNTISQKQCIEVSRKLIYPAKRDYLFAHCQNNP